MHAACRLRWMLTTLFAVTFSFIAFQPRTALAQGEDTFATGAYITESV